MSTLPEWRSEPLPVVHIRQMCPVCPRTFTMDGYSGQDLLKVDRVLTELLVGHAEREHPEPPAGES